MPKFAYTTLSVEGKKGSGVVSAASSNAAVFALGELGVIAQTLVEKKSILKFEITKKKVDRKLLMQFSRQLAVFVKASVPIL
jgi:type II secretory pathway component PulF